MKEEIWNELYLYSIRIEIGVFKNFKECACSPCNGNHFSSNLLMLREGESVLHKNYGYIECRSHLCKNNKLEPDRL